MKVAVSLPDLVFEAADALAAELKVSRSHLYAQAIEHFLASHRQDDLTRHIDAFIDQHGQPVDEVFLAGAAGDLRRDLGHDAW